MKVCSELVNVFGVVNKGLKFRGVSLEDDLRSEFPEKVTTEEIIDIIHEVVKNDRKLTTAEIFQAMNISTESVLHIFKDVLSLRKPCVRWVPLLLNYHQRRTLLNYSKEHLNLFLFFFFFKKSFVTMVTVCHYG